MKHLLLIGLISAIALVSPRVWADEPIDTGWIEIKPTSLVQSYEGERITVTDIEFIEQRAIHTDSLAVVTMVFHTKNKTSFDLYFDIDVMALDDKGEVLFVQRISPDLFGIGAGSTALLSESRYVLPGTLDRVATYRARLVGFSKDNRP